MYNNYQMHDTYSDFNCPEPLYKHVCDIHKKCVDHINKKVKVTTVDQNVYEGFIQHVDNNYIYLIIDNQQRDENSDNRFYGYPGYGYPGYGYPGYGYAGFGYPGYGFGGGLGGLLLPLFGLAAISAIR